MSKSLKELEKDLEKARKLSDKAYAVYGKLDNKVDELNTAIRDHADAPKRARSSNSC